MPPTPIIDLPNAPQSTELRNAYEVLRIGHASILNMFSIFDNNRARQGAPPAVDQDVLRSAIIFAGATFDSAVKHLIRECLDLLVGDIDQTSESFMKYIERRLKNMSHDQLAKDLSQAFFSPVPQEYYLSMYLEDLVGNSLQSYDQINKIWSLFGLGTPTDQAGIRSALIARNKIVHELDVNFDRDNRNRNSRRREDCAIMTNCLLKLTSDTLSKVDELLAAQ